MKKPESPKPEVVELEGKDAFLDCICININGMSIVVLDEKLNELADDNPDKARLMHYRKQIDAAYSNNDFPLLEERLEKFYIGLKGACFLIPKAIVGDKFTGGRKPETGGPIRKAIAELLKAEPKSREYQPRHFWAHLKVHSPRGWKFREAPQLGKYIEGPKQKTGGLMNMSYTRFCQVCKEEKDKLQS